MSTLAAVTDDSFEEIVMQSDIPVLVDFWAEWCGPCRALKPILESLAPLYADKLLIVTMNVDENQEIPARYTVRGIPTLLLFKDKQMEATKIGALSKSQLTAFLDSHI